MQEEDMSTSLLQTQSSKRKRVTESASGHEMVPNQAGGANTIGANNQEQWWRTWTQLGNAIRPVGAAMLTNYKRILKYDIWLIVFGLEMLH